MNENEPLTIPELGRAIGQTMDPRTLRDELLRREKRAGVEFVTRITGARRTNYKCTVAAVRRYAGDLVKGNVNHLLREAREELAQIEQRCRAAAADEVQGALERIEPRIAQVEGDSRDMAQEIVRISRHLNRLDEEVLSIKATAPEGMRTRD